MKKSSLESDIALFLEFNVLIVAIAVYCSGQDKIFEDQNNIVF